MENNVNTLRKELINLKNKNGNVLMALQLTQNKFGYICEETIKVIADVFGESKETIYSTATFYSQFKMQKKGEHTVSVCLGTACFVLGAQEILNEVERCLNIKEGETTPDGFFSLDTVRCVGCCSLAPLMMVDDHIYGNLKKEQVAPILEKFRNGEF